MNMVFNDTAIIFTILASLLFILSIFFAFQLWVKKTKGKTLDKNISELTKTFKTQNITLDQISNDIKIAEDKYKHIIELKDNEDKLNTSVEELSTKSDSLNELINKYEKEKSDLEKYIFSIKEDITLYEPKQTLINLGFVEEPDYIFETSDRYKEEIKILREKQKELTKSNNCIEIPEELAAVSDPKLSNNILKGQADLMIKAFNIECDLLMGQVKSSNYSTILERIDKSATNIEKLAASLKCGFTSEYIELKFRECELQYQFKLKQAREQEEQALIKERMREEQKAIKEFERALTKAQKEEEMYKNALEAARKELEIVGDKNKDKLEAKILLLEQQLTEAEENQKRAQSMAEQTRRGYVYVISNIGSFGEDIYKIGLTRRLEPMDRVKELGDASVPFSFDVHAMIFSEDAPALETVLHKEFARYRVNQVNHRKEFFKVTLLNIQKTATGLVDNEIDFKVTALAEEYYESLKLKDSLTEAENNS